MNLTKEEIELAIDIIREMIGQQSDYYCQHYMTEDEQDLGLSIINKLKEQLK